MWESQDLLMDGQVVFPGFSGFRPPLMNDRLDISEIFLKGPENPNQMKKKCDSLNIGSVWHHDWQHNKYRSPWPIFHGPVILPHILNVNWCMNIIIWDYELVWSNSWPESKCRSLWPIFHGPVILCYNLMYYYHILGLCDLYFIALWFCLISPTVWYLNVIFTYNDTVWPKLSPQSKYKSVWPIFHGLVILLNMF